VPIPIVVSWRGSQPCVARIVLVAALYAATAKGGLALGTSATDVTAVWAPSGIALVAVVLWGRRMLPAVALGAVLANIGMGVGPLTVAGIATGNTLEALAGAWLLSRAGFRPALPRLRDLAALVVAAGLLSTLVAATVGVASLLAGGAVSAADAAGAWLTWWLGDMGGDLLVAPSLFVLFADPPRAWPRRAMLEAGALALATAMVSAIVFSVHVPLVFLTFPLIVWGALRFTQAGAAATCLVVAGFAIAEAAAGHGPFHDASTAHALLLAQVFGTFACITALVLAIVVRERERAVAELRRSRDELEQKIREGTAALTGAHAQIAARHELAPIGSWDWDIETGEVRWSAELRAIYGLADDDPAPTYETYLARVHPDDRTTVRDTIARARADGLPFTLDERIIRPDGSVRMLASGGQVVTDAGGRPVRMLGICQDVTEGRRAARELLESQERAALIVEASGHAFISIDAAGRIIEWNTAAERLLGWSRAEALGRSLAETILPEADRARHRAGLARVVAGGTSQVVGRTLEIDALHRDGHLIAVDAAISATRSQGVYSFHAFLYDISARRHGARLLATENAVGQALLESSSLDEARRRVLDEIGTRLGWAYGGWWAMGGPAGSPHREATWWAPGVGPALLQRAADAPFLPGIQLPARVRRSWKTVVLSDLGGEAGMLSAIGVPVISRGEVVAVVEFACTEHLRSGDDTDRMLQRVSEALSSYVERERMEGQLQHLADHDPLTDLFNQRRFDEEIERELASARRYGTGGAILALDLDDFKDVNDTLGHDAGNALLASVAELMRVRLRGTDILARLGGDEFAAILPHTDEGRARHIAEELLYAIREHAIVTTARGSCRTTASIGIAVLADRPDSPSAEELLTEADRAMYDAKEAGRDQVRVYDPRTSRLLGRTMAEQIRAALADDRFVLHAQPIVALRGDGPDRHELFVRMIGAGGELVAPGAFLATAERVNLVQELDRWVVRHAIALLAKLQRDGRDDCFDINLSARSIADPELYALIERELASTGVDPGRLTFEVTETVAIADLGRARRLSAALGEQGCRFALDDFGTGFASFSILKRLPFDEVKIHGEFVEDLVASGASRLIVRSIVEIAHGLGMLTVAECVGDEATIDLLRRYGVDYAQGFHLGRPIPLESLSLA